MVGKKFATLDDVEVLVRKLLRKVRGATVGSTGAGGGGAAGANAFIDLSDVPGSYVGESHHLVRVKATEDGLEFYDLPVLCLGDLCDVETGSAYAPTDGDCLVWDAALGRWIPAFCGGGSGGGGAPADAEYVVGAASGGLSAERVKPALYRNYDPDDYPASPDAMDDEFDDGAIDGKWTKVNNPAGADAMNETTFPGFLHVGLAELVADDFAHVVCLHQTPPAGSAAWAFVLKGAIGCHGLESSTDQGEFLSVAIYLSRRSDSVDASCLFQLNDGIADYHVGRAQGSINFSTPAFNNYELFPPTGFVYLKLSKTTANAYTSANVYDMFFSLNGITWYHVGQQSKTFTNAPDEVGIYFRAPKPQLGTPWGYSVVDFFRKVA